MSTTLPSCTECNLRRIALCGTIAERAPVEYSRLSRSFERVKARRLICRAGTIPTSLSFIYEGWAIAFRILSNGRRQIIDIRLPGDVIGLRAVPALPLTLSVQAVTDVTLCVFERQEIIDLGMRDPETANELYRRSMNYIHSLEDRLVEISRHSAASRIASLILRLRDKLTQRGRVQDNAFEFPLTQSQIADACGLTTAHVNRVLSELRFGGVMSLASGRLAIQNEEYLLVLARSAEG